jgi:hypothetical protein
MAIFQPPTQNSLQMTLDAQLAAGETSTLTLNQDVSSLLQAPGVLWVDRVDSNGDSTPTKREYIKFTGVSGSTVTGLTRGLAGSTDQVHAVSAIVEFGPDIVQSQAIYDTVVQEHSTVGTHTSLPSVSILSVKSHFSVSGASVTGVFPEPTSGIKGVFSWGQDKALVTSLVTVTDATSVMAFQRATQNLTLNGFWAGVASAPSTSAVLMDVKYSSLASGPWTSIFTDKPFIDIGENDTDSSASTSALALTSLASGTLLRAEIEQPGDAGVALIQLPVTTR